MGHHNVDNTSFISFAITLIIVNATYNFNRSIKPITKIKPPNISYCPDFPQVSYKAATLWPSCCATVTPVMHLSWLITHCGFLLFFSPRSPYRGLKMRLSFWESSFLWVEALATPTITTTTITTSLPPPCRPPHHSSSSRTMTLCHRSSLQWWVQSLHIIIICLDYNIWL